jgi:drug/metabolite transporter (DMT)-like permease
MIMYGFFGLVFSLLLHFTIGDIFEPDIDLFMGFLAGILNAVGTVFLNHALMSGYVGPTCSIINLIGVFQVSADFLIYGIEPGLLKIIGTVIASLGAIWMLLGDDVFYRSG